MENSTSTSENHCPISGLPITRVNEWNYTASNDQFHLTIERVGDHIYVLRAAGKMTIDDLNQRRERLRRLLADDNKESVPRYLIEDLSGVERISLQSRGEYSAWTPPELAHFELVAVCGLSRATKPLVRVSKLLAADLTSLQSADDYAAAMQLILRHQAGDASSGEFCPVSGLPITRREEWSHQRAESDFYIEAEQIGRHILLIRPMGSPTVEDLIAHRQLIERVIADANHDGPFYLIEALNGMTGFADLARKEYREWFPYEHEKLALIGVYGMNRSIKPLIQMGTALNPTATPLKVTAGYEEAIRLALQYQGGQAGPELASVTPKRAREMLGDMVLTPDRPDQEDALDTQAQEPSMQVGRYQVQGTLGHGGMATVYKALDPSFNRPVAVKILTPTLLNDDNSLARFEREAQIVASLEHPSIVPVYDFGQYNDRPYLVMRYMSGGCLADRVKQGALPLAEATRILQPVAQALDYAHSRGIIHRDLKPANIFFDQYDQPYLADFGIARLQEGDDLLLTGTRILGTPAYMSPEQIAQDREIDHRADIYALGIVAYQMVTGQLPFSSETAMGLAMKHLMDPVPPVAETAPHAPAACQPVLEKAMAKEPEQRFQTASEMIAALAQIAAAPAADETEEPASSPAAENNPGPARNWLLIILFIIILLALALPPLLAWLF